MRRSVFLLSVVVLLSAGMVMAQGTTGTIRVLAVAEDGALLPGVTVTAESVEALGARNGVSNQDGVATLAGLDPSAVYMVTVSLDGFSTKRYENVLVRAGQMTTVRATMTIAAVEEEIIVVAEAPAIDFSSAISGQDITLELTEALPTGRSYQSYLQLVPGVMPTDPTERDENPAARGGLNYSDIGGNLGRSSDNFYYIEGIDVTDGRSGFHGANLNTEIIQEQSVMTGGIPAEFAGSPGLVSSVITKAGGNEYHGSFNYFFQNDSLMADNENAAEGSFSTYDAAFTLGGPLMQDKFWFFASYRLVDREEDVSSLDTDEYMRTVTTSQDQAFAKLSWAATDTIKFTGTFLSDPTDIDGEVDREVTNQFDRKYEQGGDRYILNYSQVLGSAFLSLSFGEHSGEESAYAVVPEARNDVYFKAGDDHNLTDEQLGGWGNYAYDERNNEFAKGKFDWFLGFDHGDHTLSLGVESLNHVNTEDDRYQGGAIYGSLDARYAGTTADEITFESWTNRDWRVNNTSDFVGLINGINASANRDAHYAVLDLNGDGVLTQEEVGQALIFDSTAGNPHGMVNYYRITEENVGPVTLKTKGLTYYLQDTFQTDRLTISAGVRTEQWKHIATNGENIFTFDWELAPRVGVIYDLKGDGKQKLSAYYGRYYDPIRLNMTDFAGSISGRYRVEQVYVNGEWITYRERGYTDAAFAPSTQTPYTDDLQLGYAVELGNNMSLEVLGIKRDTQDILEDYDLCLYAECTDGTNYYPGDINAPGSLWLGLDYFGYSQNPGTNFVIATLEGGKREWQGIELVFRKRYSDNWQMLASYTYGDGNGNSNSDSNADFQGDVEWLDPRAPHQWGRQPGLIEHLFKAAGSYHFDNGFLLGGSFRWNSGTVASNTWSIYGRNLPNIGDEYEWNGATSTWLTPDAVGAVKNDSWGQLDLRAQYTYDFGPVVGEFFLDIFNVLDDQAAIRNQDLLAGQGATQYGDPIQWVDPRRYYLGARISF